MLTLLLAASTSVFALQSVQPLEPETKNVTIISLSWSADGKRLAYTGAEMSDPAKFDIKQMGACVVDVEKKTRIKIPGQATTVALTSDGKSVILGANRDGKNKLYRFDYEDSVTTLLTPGDSISTSPSCSPTEDLIAFSSTQGGDDLQVYTMHKDGSAVTKITHGPGKAFNPIWSFDGKHVIYYRELGDHKDQIYVIDPDGSNQKHVSRSDEHSCYPAFLPSGDLSYATPRDGAKERAIIVDTQGTLKSEWPYETSFLRWSPQGKAAFIAGQRGKSAVYVADADGKHPLKISP